MKRFWFWWSFIMGFILFFILTGCGGLDPVYTQKEQQTYYTALGQCMQAPQSALQTFEELYKACDAVARTRRDRQ